MERVNITEFLLARIAEDEAVAKAAWGESPWVARERWHTTPFGRNFNTFVVMDGQREVTIVSMGGSARHIAHWHPARALAECAAKRAIVGLHGAAHDYADHYRKPTPLVVCVECGPHEDVDWRTGGQGNFPCSTIRALAAVYADHPDCDTVWRV